MPQVHEFGDARVPVCIGAIKAGGREKLFGEYVPEALTWDARTQQLHVSLGNLAFVTPEQARAMGAEAEKHRLEALRKDLTASIVKTQSAYGTFSKVVIDLERRLVEARANAAVAAKAVADAESLLAKFDAGDKIEAEAGKVPLAAPIAQGGEPDSKPSEDASTATKTAEKLVDEVSAKIGKADIRMVSVAQLEAEKVVETAKAAEKVEAAKLETVQVKLTEVEERQISEEFESLGYRELQKISQRFGINGVGKSKKELIPLVADAMKAKALDEKRQAAAVAVVAETSAAVASVE